MKIIKSAQEYNQLFLSLKSNSIGFVPTMGALHQGHLSLFKQSQVENDITVASIFINPIQFNSQKDFINYPVTIEQDLQLLDKNNIDFVFLPSVDEIYPPGFNSQIIVHDLTSVLEGEARPGHFNGVTTIVAKLFNIIKPTRVYFGQKDAQQLAVIKKMVLDLNLPVEVIGCPTIREPNGLAMSSRNMRLTKSQYQEATILFQSLQLAKQLIEDGEKDSAVIIKQMSELINTTKGKVDYIAINYLDNLLPCYKINHQTILISLAVFFDSVRLIDNLIVTPL